MERMARRGREVQVEGRPDYPEARWIGWIEEGLLFDDE
jgi:hypothetical protein